MQFLFLVRLQAEASLQVFSKVLLRFVAIYNEFLDILWIFVSKNAY